MQYYYGTHCTLSAIHLLLQQVDDRIDQIEATKQIPKFLAPDINTLIEQISAPLVAKAESKNTLLQQNWKSVPKINKDSLMPKDVDKEPMPQQIKPLSVKTKVNTKQFSTISKKSSSKDFGIKSLSLAERRSLKAAKEQSKLQMLRIQVEEDDPQMMKIRQRTDMRIKHQQEYQRMILNRQKSFIEKSQFLSQLTEGQPNAFITHDYEGQQLKSMIADEKIKSYLMKAQFAPMVKGKKGSLGQPQFSTIEINRGKEKERANRTIRAMQMPLFPNPQRDLSTLHEVKNYKLQDYRKHFGRRYSRLDQSQTIDTSFKEKQEVHKEDLFSERKHLRDSSTLALQTSRQSVMDNRVMRRLALPRLHGKYTVLDRYQQY